MKNKFKAISALMLIGSLCSLSAHSMEPEKSSQNEKLKKDMTLAQSHFREDKAFIEKFLKDLPAELHFFWTTGRTITEEQAQKFNADLKVDVGGSDYGQKFFPYVRMLLENSPKNLKIKFVCDETTYNSNSEAIEGLHDDFGIRFYNKFIDNFNYKGKHEDTVNKVMKNATAGSPVLSSDLYRIIGMPIKASGVYSGIQFTYCDIDTFCHGIENSHHQDLIQALFKPVPNSEFYFGRTSLNNDLIKLFFKDSKTYVEFCEKRLVSLGNNYVVSYFPELHDAIKLFETDQQKGISKFNNLSALSGKWRLKDQIMQATGPDSFLLPSSMGIEDLHYPNIFAGEWQSPDDILVLTKHYEIEQPNNDGILYWDWVETKTDEQIRQVYKSFNQACDQYRKAFSAAFYARKFGNKHPFNIYINKYLMENFPFDQQSFKSVRDLHQQYFNRHQKNPSQETWRNDILHEMNNKSCDDTIHMNLYRKYLSLFNKLGIQYNVTPENIFGDKRVFESKAPVVIQTNSQPEKLVKPTVAIVEEKSILKKGETVEKPIVMQPEKLVNPVDPSQLLLKQENERLIRENEKLSLDNQRLTLEKTLLGLEKGDLQKEINRLNELVKQYETKELLSSWFGK